MKVLKLQIQSGYKTIIYIIKGIVCRDQHRTEELSYQETSYMYTSGIVISLDLCKVVSQ